jgi:hypothetical protein
MEPISDERISVFDWIKCQTLPGGSTEPLFVQVEHRVSDGVVELVSTKANADAATNCFPGLPSPLLQDWKNRDVRTCLHNILLAAFVF